MRLEGKIAIVTGASAGLGKAIAEMFIREGAKVVFSDINPYPDTMPENGRYFKADTSKKEEVNALVNFAVEQFGGLNVIVNNAGIGLTGELVSLSDENWDKVIAVNLSGVFYGIRSAGAYMKDKKIKKKFLKLSVCFLVSVF